MGAFRGEGCRQRRGCEGETAVWGGKRERGRTVVSLTIILLYY